MVEIQDRDPGAQTRGTLRRSVAIAIEKLARAARGRQVFRSDHEMRACVALARLAPIMLADVPSRSIFDLVHPSLHPAEAAQILERMLRRRAMEDESSSGATALAESQAVSGRKGARP